MTINLHETADALRIYANSQIDRHGREGQVADVYAATCADIINGQFTLNDPIAIEMVKWADSRGLIR